MAHKLLIGIDDIPEAWQGTALTEKWLGIKTSIGRVDYPSEGGPTLAWERVDHAIAKGITPMLMYYGKDLQNRGKCWGVTIAEMKTEIEAIRTGMVSRGLKWLELGNETYFYRTAAEYGEYYKVAHETLAGSGIELFANSWGDYQYEHNKSVPTAETIVTGEVINLTGAKASGFKNGEQVRFTEVPTGCTSPVVGTNYEVFEEGTNSFKLKPQGGGAVIKVTGAALKTTETKFALLTYSTVYNAYHYAEIKSEWQGWCADVWKAVGFAPDAWSLHPYGPMTGGKQFFGAGEGEEKSSYESTPHMMEYSEKYAGGKKPYWITEVGQYHTGTTSGEKATEGGVGPKLSEAEYTAAVEQYCRQAHEWEIEGIMIYTLAGIEGMFTGEVTEFATGKEGGSPFETKARGAVKAMTEAILKYGSESKGFYEHFPYQGSLDSFARAKKETILSKGHGGTGAAGEWVNLGWGVGTTGTCQTEFWEGPKYSAGVENGAYWNPAKFPRAGVSVELSTFSESGAEEIVSLWACWNSATKEGYRFTITNPGFEVYWVRLQKIKGSLSAPVAFTIEPEYFKMKEVVKETGKMGFSRLIEPEGIFNPGIKMGLSCNEGYVWGWFQVAGVWEPFAKAFDSSPIADNNVGFSTNGAKWHLNNIEAGSGIANLPARTQLGQTWISVGRSLR